MIMPIAIFGVIIFGGICAGFIMDCINDWPERKAKGLKPITALRWLSLLVSTQLFLACFMNTLAGLLEQVGK